MGVFVYPPALALSISFSTGPAKSRACPAAAEARRAYRRAGFLRAFDNPKKVNSFAGFLILENRTRPKRKAQGCKPLRQSSPPQLPNPQAVQPIIPPNATKPLSFCCVRWIQNNMLDEFIQRTSRSPGSHGQQPTGCRGRYLRNKIFACCCVRLLPSSFPHHDENMIPRAWGFVNCFSVRGCRAASCI